MTSPRPIGGLANPLPVGGPLGNPCSDIIGAGPTGPLATEVGICSDLSAPIGTGWHANPLPTGGPRAGGLKVLTFSV